uniref:Uncharacterized protein n=1 Tax=Lepeophtheirus salmonis TaxID=72036 RepID=A0A0K2UZP8_LEPSM
MEKTWRNAIIESACARQSPAYIKKILSYPKFTNYDLYNRWKEGEYKKKTNKSQIDKIMTPKFIVGLKWSAEECHRNLTTVSKALLQKIYPTDKMKATRAAKGRKLLNDLKPNGNRIIFYSDDK